MLKGIRKAKPVIIFQSQVAYIIKASTDKIKLGTPKQTHQLLQSAFAVDTIFAFDSPLFLHV